jgi:hypothetical protein
MMDCKIDEGKLVTFKNLKAQFGHTLFFLLGFFLLGFRL